MKKKNMIKLIFILSVVLIIDALFFVFHISASEKSINGQAIDDIPSESEIDINDLDEGDCFKTEINNETKIVCYEGERSFEAGEVLE